MNLFGDLAHESPLKKPKSKNGNERRTTIHPWLTYPLRSYCFEGMERSEWSEIFFNMKERWKDIAGYEGIYQVSSTGRIKSLDRISYKGDKINQLKGRLLKPYLNLVSGYLSVSLSSDGIVIAFTIHRLVANAFIPNPNEYREVNHISGIKIDNSVENLEWCTRNHNIKHAYDIGLRDRYHKRKWGIIKPIDAMIMKEARAAGFLIRQIASYWKINETSVGDVLKGKHWTQRV